jgi:hypothetical protein
MIFLPYLRMEPMEGMEQALEISDIWQNVYLDQAR